MVTFHGPLFTGATEQQLKVTTREMEQRVADAFTQQWMSNMNAAFKTQTPYYMTQVVNQEMPGQHVIHDRGVIYGPWLEGVGSRNSPRTRFPGYHSMARALVTVRTKVQGICEDALRRRIGGM